MNENEKEVCMKIVLSPDPVLRTICEPCEIGDKDLKKLAQQMIKALYKNNGVGLAAPQVGVPKRLIVVDCDVDNDNSEAMVLINPVLVETSGEEVIEEEGCLSCPGISVPIKRKTNAVVRYFDLDGEEWIIEGDGLLGRCLQHELDHLDGKTLFESCDPSIKIAALQAYAEAKAAGAKPGDVGQDPIIR